MIKRGLAFAQWKYASMQVGTTDYYDYTKGYLGKYMQNSKILQFPAFEAELNGDLKAGARVIPPQASDMDTATCNTHVAYNIGFLIPPGLQTAAANDSNFQADAVSTYDYYFGQISALTYPINEQPLIHCGGIRWSYFYAISPVDQSN